MPRLVCFNSACIVLLCAWQAVAAGIDLQVQESSIQSDGKDWAQTATASFSVSGLTRLNIAAPGDIRVRGEKLVGRLVLTLQKRVRSANAAAAAQALQGLILRPGVAGDLLWLRIKAPTGGPSTVLTLTAPRSLRELNIQTTGGTLDISDLDGAVRAQTGGGAISIARMRGTVRATSGGGAIRVDGCGPDSWFSTLGGDIIISQAAGLVHASTSAGDVRVSQASSDVYAHTGGGRIEVRQAGGFVTAAADGGALDVDSAKGTRCELGAGSIRLRNVTSGPVYAATGLGSIAADFNTGSTLEDALLSAAWGDITVRLSSNIAVTVQARNQSEGPGRIVSDFPEIRMVQPPSWGLAPVLAEGNLAGGGPLLRIFDTGGNIYLRRK